MHKRKLSEYILIGTSFSENKIYVNVIGEYAMKKQSFLFGAVILAASAAITKIIGALFRIPLADMLGGTGMGYFSCAYGIFLPVYAVTATGLPAAAARVTAGDMAVRGGASLKRIRFTAMAMFGAAGLVGMLVILLGALPFCRYAIDNMPALPAVLMTAPAVLFGCPLAVLRGYYEGLRNMYPTALSQVAEAAVKLASGLGGAYAVLDLYAKDPAAFAAYVSADTANPQALGEIALSYAAAAACGGMSLSVLAGLLFMVIYDVCAGRKSVHAEGQAAPYREIIRSLASVAVPGAFCALAANITSVIDLATIMNSLENVAESASMYFSEYDMSCEDIPNFIYGSYAGRAVTVFNLIPSVTNMFGRGILPQAAEAYSSGDRARLARSAEEVIFLAAAVAVPCGFGISALAEPILKLLFSGNTAEINAAAAPLAAMGPGVIFLCISSAVFPLFQAADRSDIPLKLTLLGAAVKAAGNILLVSVPWLNVTGAAISTDLCYLAVCIGEAVLLERTTGADLKCIGITLAKLFLCGFLCAVTAETVYGYMQIRSGNSISVIISVAAAAFVYIISTYFIGIINKSTLKMLISQKNSKNT